MREDFTTLLQREIKPALGVTEVGAIALAAARAYDAVGGDLLEIRMTMNGGMYKNAFSCAIPGTEELGCELAAALGALGGDWRLGLEALKHITPAHVAAAKALTIPIRISVDETKDQIFIEAEIETTAGVGLARIEAFHSNIVHVAKNGETLFAAEETAAAAADAFDFESVTVAEMFDYAQNAPLAALEPIRGMIEMNCALSAEGEKGVGLGIWRTLSAFQAKGLLGGTDLLSAAQRLTCSAMDARLAGLPFPAMSIVGSGSHGILCSLPVVSCGRYLKKTEEDILRAVTLSALVTIFSKHYTGRLSALCGCVLGGGSGAAAGIVYLLGGGAAEAAAAMDHMAANLTGMICDGGSTGCALKASAGVYAAYLSAMLAVEGTAIPHHFGIIGSSAEQTERNLGRISDEGMSPMDATIINIMQRGE